MMYKKQKAKDPDFYKCRDRKYLLKSKYDMTKEDYDVILESQNGVCKICGTKPKRKNLSVDHDHSSGEIRGLLCNRCNRVLGMVMDDQEILREMIEYL